ncbi:MAG: alpha/beta hydrolase [Eubacteriaceae bacterium]|jgi:alpha-beta hydrolase superfamily lysophospholipase|nr:alpha/beta hydrolase [Eubacteriaceae bacterium]
MAQRTDFTFLSNDKETNIHAVKWMPDSGDYSAVLQLTHGMVEYIDRYIPFAEFMADHGFLVVGHDHLGHGQSAAVRSDLGYFAEGRGDVMLVEDMHKLRLITQEEPANASLPYFMLGHSMGSYMLREYLSSYGEGLAGAIIMGTGDVPASTSKMGIAMCKTIARFHGWRYRSKFVQNLTYTKPYKRYDLTGADLNNSWLGKDPQIIDKYMHDPFCTYVFTLNGYRGLFESVLFSCDPKNIDLIPKDLPVLIVSGADDPVGDMGEGVKHVFEQYKKAGIVDVSMKLYEGDRHEILNELDKDVVFADLLEWINSKK